MKAGHYNSTSQSESHFYEDSSSFLPTFEFEIKSIYNRLGGGNLSDIQYSTPTTSVADSSEDDLTLSKTKHDSSSFSGYSDSSSSESKFLVTSKKEKSHPIRKINRNSNLNTSSDVMYDDNIIPPINDNFKFLVHPIINPPSKTKARDNFFKKKSISFEKLPLLLTNLNDKINLCKRRSNSYQAIKELPPPSPRQAIPRVEEQKSEKKIEEEKLSIEFSTSESVNFKGGLSNSDDISNWSESSYKTTVQDYIFKTGKNYLYKSYEETSDESLDRSKANELSSHEKSRDKSFDSSVENSSSLRNRMHNRLSVKAISTRSLYSDDGDVFKCSNCNSTVEKIYEVVFRGCNHVFCVRCCEGKVKHQVENFIVGDVQCILNLCHGTVKPSELDRIDPILLEKLALLSKYQSHKQLTTRARWCPTSGCLSICVKPQNFLVGQPYPLQCTGKCCMIFCSECANNWEHHEGKSCSNYKKILRQQSIMSSEAFSGISCPSCNAAVAQNEFNLFDVISCSVCNTRFCTSCVAIVRTQDHKCNAPLAIDNIAYDQLQRSELERKKDTNCCICM